jgi:hypothetical protein
VAPLPADLISQSSLEAFALLALEPVPEVQALL